MRAMVRDRYGSPDVLHPAEVERPELPPGAALVRVRATSVNAYDWHMLRGAPYFARFETGLRRPKERVLGVDVAGIVEEVGPESPLRIGDHVVGARSGAWAELIAGKTLVPMPAGLSFTDAAALPVAGMTALQGIRDRGRLQPGERVLVTGAGGGVGTLAVQIAKALGASTVTATTRAKSVETLHSLGADEVLDHAREDVTRRRRSFDLVLDVGGRQTMRALRGTLRPGGRIVLVAPHPGNWIGPLARIVGAAAANRLGRPPAIPFLSQSNRDDLATLIGMVDAGMVRPVVERVYAFEELPDAVRAVEAGVTGKAVVSIP